MPILKDSFGSADDNNDDDNYADYSNADDNNADDNRADYNNAEKLVLTSISGGCHSL